MIFLFLLEIPAFAGMTGYEEISACLWLFLSLFVIPASIRHSRPYLSFPRRRESLHHQSFSFSFTISKSSYQSALKSYHYGFISFIILYFHALFHFFNCFSRVIALSGVGKQSYQTNLQRLYLSVKHLFKCILCSYTLRSILFVMPI